MTQQKTKPSQELSARQTETLAYILDCWANGWIPSHRCIADFFGMAWGTVAKHITALKKKGYLTNSGERTPLRLTPKAIAMSQCIKVAASDRTIGLHGALQK